MVGFPRSFSLAYAMMTEALKAIVQTFLSAASNSENELPKIITRKDNIIKL